MLTEGLAKLGIHAIVAPDTQSYIITTFDLGSLVFAKIYQALKSRGFVIYPGKLTSIPTFRLGNMAFRYYMGSTVSSDGGCGVFGLQDP